MFVYLALLLMAAPQGGSTGVEGLWRYRTIAPGGGAEVPIDGLFVFKDGRFVQQSLNAGEPFDRQLAQAHAGTYAVDGGSVKLHAEIGLVVDPKRDPALENRRGSRHELSVSRSGDRLNLTFGTGTVQTFERVGEGDGSILPLEDGALALVDGYFLLVYENGELALAGSGTFERVGESLRLRAERWLSVRSGRPESSRDREIQARLTAEALELPDGIRLPLR